MRLVTRAAHGGDPGSGAGDRLDRGLLTHADGLYTYCLSVLCDADEALAALRTVRQLAHRHRRKLRRADLLRAWLYALARQVCLTWLEQRPMGVRDAGPRAQEARQRAQLALLVWPEAAGTSSEQREALELALRHGLPPEELAAVLGLSEQSARRLVTQAVCEVERTRAALTVLASGACPVLARLGGGAAAAHGLAPRPSALGPTLRGELVRHVDECPTCRGSAEQATADGPWPGTARPPGTLPLVAAPVEALFGGPAESGPDTAGAAAAAGAFPGGESSGSASPGSASPGGLPSEGAPVGGVEPRFDREGFPVQRARNPERGAVLRHRAVMTTAVAAVVAAPALALWAAQREEPQRVATTGQDVPVGPSASASGLDPASETARATLPPSVGSTPEPDGSADGASATPRASGSNGARPPAKAGRLSVGYQEAFGRTMLTIANTGSGKASWWAVADAPWLRLSRSSGVLAPGERVLVLITADESREPQHAWTARVSVQPSTAIVPVSGPGRERGPGQDAGPGPGPARPQTRDWGGADDRDRYDADGGGGSTRAIPADYRGGGGRHRAHRRDGDGDGGGWGRRGGYGGGRGGDGDRRD
ncbi:sigma-70 family RNA polymerase sigma factor [Phaeacidiphilus oryzae]|uniref:sigma-70 family RNA polymerase sigma factor n=1 Tax=Phaeacidiphilus oryzae TaxID=348818 RepID=UPI0006910005|nr:sigma-70 family RNA polymerase sigma factor [Phaeacidiphilus oryzae]